MQTPVEKFRKDYAAPNYWVTEIQLVLKIYEDYAQILSTLQVKRAGGAPVDAPFVLDGEELELASISLDGEVLPADRYSFVEEDVLQIKGPLPDAFKLECDVKVKPHLNTQLSGLYKSSGVYCTQCEAEGFRRITLMQDRPDVMARFAPRTTLAVRSCACGCAQLRKRHAPPKKIMCVTVWTCVYAMNAATLSFALRRAKRLAPFCCRTAISSPRASFRTIAISPSGKTLSKSRATSSR